jgi:hypothetical protein
MLLLAFAAIAQDQPGTVKFPTALDSQDSLIRATDNARTSLSSGVLSTATSIAVGSTSSFPSSGVGMCDNEIFYYTSKDSTHFLGATRGADGTTAANHDAGASVRVVMAAVHHTVLGDALRAVQTKVGAGSSTAALNQVLVGTGPNASAWQSQPALDGTNFINVPVTIPPTLSGKTLNNTILSGTLAGLVDSMLPSTMASKTLNSPIINSPTITSPSFSGGLTVSGTVNATAFVDSGVGLTGIGTGTGGVINTGSTTASADSDVDGVGVVALQTRGLTRLQIENAGRTTLMHASGTGSFDILRINYNDPNGFGDFNFIQRLIANTNTLTNSAQTGRRDNVSMFGYNIAGSGKQVSGEHSFVTSLESRYITSGGVTQLEYYNEYINAAGTGSSRPFSITVDLDTDVATLRLDGNSNIFADPTGNNAYIVASGDETGGSFNLYGNTAINFQTGVGAQPRFRIADGGVGWSERRRDLTSSLQMWTGRTER